MEDRLLKFARVVEIGSITRAAQDLHISQPALSNAIHKLERELKAQLIKHSGRTIEITPAGQLAYQTAASLRTRLQDMQQELLRLHNHKPHVRIGMIDSLAELLCITGDLLQQIDEIASASLTVNNSTHLLEAVRHGQLDIALVAGEVADAANLTVVSVGSEPLALVASAGNEQQARVNLKQGRIPNFLAYNPTSNTFQLVAEHLARLGLRVNTVFHSTSPEVILRLVMNGRGVAVLPLQMIAEHIDTNKLLQLLPGTIDRPINAITEKDRATSETIDMCIRHARNSLGQLRKVATRN